jgi:hypothetical protein
MPDANLPVHASEAPQLTTHSGLPLREDVLYTNAQGKEKTGIRKRADQALGRLKDVLARLVGPDEVILYVARAQVYPNLLEQLFSGWHYYLRPSAQLVFTNRRLLVFRTCAQGWGRWKWDRGIRSLCWGDVAEAKVKGGLNRMFELGFRNGARERFWRIRAADARKIRLLVSLVVPAGAGDSSAAQGFLSLCPTCLGALAPRVYLCPQCRAMFKDEGTLLRRGLLIPGGACFYVGWTTLGVLNMLAEGLLLLAVISFVVGAFFSTPGASAHRDASRVGDAITAAMVLLAFLVLDKSVAWIHCRGYVRDFVPEG